VCCLAEQPPGDLRLLVLPGSCCCCLVFIPHTTQTTAACGSERGTNRLLPDKQQQAVCRRNGCTCSNACRPVTLWMAVWMARLHCCHAEVPHTQTHTTAAVQGQHMHTATETRQNTAQAHAGKQDGSKLSIGKKVFDSVPAFFLSWRSVEGTCVSSSLGSPL